MFSTSHAPASAHTTHGVPVNASMHVVARDRRTGNVYHVAVGSGQSRLDVADALSASPFVEVLS